MTKEEYLALKYEKLNKIAEIHSEIDKIEEHYIKDNALYKVGERIRLNGKEGVISSIRLCADMFNYSWRPFRKDGKNGAEKRIWGYEENNIEKL